MIFDLHVHSTFSRDSPVTVEEYAQKTVELKSRFPIHGFVLMEHNYLVEPAECDLAALGEKYGILILAGIEIDTYWGHMLVYGIGGELWTRIKQGLRPGSKKTDPQLLAESVKMEKDMLMVPAHPYRFFIGPGERCASLPGVGALEVLNGANEDVENYAALELAMRKGLTMTGGSDAHFLPELGKCLTGFEKQIGSMPELVAEIKAGRCRALTGEQVVKG